MRPFLKSLSCAWRGLRQAFDNQRNIKIQSCCAAAALIFGPACGLSVAEMAIVVLTSGLVLSLEIANTALETLADTLHPKQHPGIGRAKDLMAGAVLMSSLAAVVIGILLFGKNLIW